MLLYNNVARKRQCCGIKGLHYLLQNFPRLRFRGVRGRRARCFRAVPPRDSAYPLNCLMARKADAFGAFAVEIEHERIAEAVGLAHRKRGASAHAIGPRARRPRSTPSKGFARGYRRRDRRGARGFARRRRSRQAGQRHDQAQAGVSGHSLWRSSRNFRRLASSAGSVIS
jgi:hypothetical protein